LLPLNLLTITGGFFSFFGLLQRNELFNLSMSMSLQVYSKNHEVTSFWHTLLLSFSSSIKYNSWYVHVHVHNGPTADEIVSPVTTAYSPQIQQKPQPCLEKQRRQLLHKFIQISPLYATRQCDGIMPPHKTTSTKAYKIVSLPLLPLKTKETTFHILNRTIWTRKKAFKPGMAIDATCLQCDETETPPVGL
jgi:hypothetical protein